MGQHTIKYLEMADCTFDPLPTYDVSFWECFSGCANATGITPTA